MSNFILSNEIEFILESSKIEKNNILIEEKINSIKDWDFLLNLSYSHGVFPLVNNVLKIYKHKIPFCILRKSKDINMDIIKQNMLMTSELIKLIKFYEKENINVIAFKGPLLSELAYGNITLRQYVDLDILIERKDFEKVKSINLRNNYLISNPKFFKNQKNLNYLKDISFFNSSLGVCIEIHFKQFNLSLLNNYNIFNSCHTICLNGYNIKTFNLDYLLVYLSIHGSRHIWERLEWIVDIDRLIINQSEHIDLKKIYLLAEKEDSENSVSLAFYLCEYLFDNKIISDNIDKSYFNDDVKKLANEVIKNYNTSRNISNYQIFKFHNKLFKNRFSKILLFLSIFKINDRDLNFVSLPNNFYFLYYFIKPIRIIKSFL